MGSLKYSVIPNQTLFINQNIYLSKITESTTGMRICGDNWQAEIEDHLMEQVSAKEKLKVQTYQTSFVTIKIKAVIKNLITPSESAKD